jgi:hypothetical protein
MNPLSVLDLITRQEFQTGLVYGLFAVVALLLVRKAGWFLLWGIAAALAVNGAGFLRASPSSPAWGLPAVAVATLAAALAFRTLARQMPAWAVGLAFSLWVLGVWGTVPDTERARVAMGVTAALLPCLWPGLRIRLGWEGMLLAAAVLGYVAVADGAARPPAIVGALGMVGMPVTAALASRWFDARGVPSPFGLVAAMALHVVVCGRVAAQLPDVRVALVVACLSALATGAGLALFGGSRPGRALRPGP